MEDSGSIPPATVGTTPQPDMSQIFRTHPVVADYSTLEEQVDVITAWFPIRDARAGPGLEVPSRSSRQKNSFVASRGIWFTTARFSW